MGNASLSAPTLIYGGRGRLVMIRVLLYEQVPRPESRAAIIAVSPRRSQKAHPKGELARLCALIALPLSGRGACSYRTPRTACPFRAHFNIWWARHGWPLIHPVARPQSLFSRPPYFPAGVNLTAEVPSEPPRGGEHGAGENCLNRQRSFAESRNG